MSKVSTPGSVAALASPALARKLTPGQLKKKEEAAKKREALEAEKKAKKEEMDKKREEERVEKERKKEVEKRAREVVALEKERERKEKELEKEKEKKEKEEEREKKKVEKELLIKEKEEEKKAQEAAEKEKLMKKAQAFKSFFKKDDGPVKVEDSEKDEKVEEARGNFTVFRVKKNMRLAPTVRGEEDNISRENLFRLLFDLSPQATLSPPRAAWTPWTCPVGPRDSMSPASRLATSRAGRPGDTAGRVANILPT